MHGRDSIRESILLQMIHKGYKIEKIKLNKRRGKTKNEINK